VPPKHDALSRRGIRPQRAIIGQPEAARQPKRTPRPSNRGREDELLDLPSAVQQVEIRSRVPSAKVTSNARQVMPPRRFVAVCARASGALVSSTSSMLARMAVFI